MFVVNMAIVLLGVLITAFAIPNPRPLALDAGAHPGRALPTPVDAARARTLLAALPIEEDSNSATYTRNSFPSWSIVNRPCNTRHIVLQRDGENVVVDARCNPISGSWLSPYDNVTVTVSREVDIDHVVPLKEAWISGASSWDDTKRGQFANDLTRPQLVAVSFSSNRMKGAKGVLTQSKYHMLLTLADPADWVPSFTSYVCTYVRAWVQVKHHYGLNVDKREKEALTSHLSSC